MSIPAYSTKGTSANVLGDACVGTWDVSPTCPGTVNAGDVLICVIYLSCFAAGTIDSATPATGWTLINSSGFGSNRAAVAFYKIADGTEDSATPFFSGYFSAGNINGSGQIYLYTGSGTGGVVPSSGTTHKGTSSSATMSNVTTTAANSLAVCLVIHGASIADATGEAGGNWTKAATTDNIGTTNVANQTAQMASVGSITGGTASLGASAIWFTISFEIKEVVASSGSLPPRDPLRPFQHLLIR